MKTYELYIKQRPGTPELILSSVSFSEDGHVDTAHVDNGAWTLRRSGDSYNACAGTHVVTSGIFTVDDIVVVEQGA